MQVGAMLRLRPLVRSAHTVARTINLAEPCARPQKLVSADVSKPCPNTEALPATCQPTRAVPVRICKRKDLERACQPKVIFNYVNWVIFVRERQAYWFGKSAELILSAASSVRSCALIWNSLFGNECSLYNFIDW